MVNIKQVAALAGVSPTTASYALNGRQEVKEATRKKVEEAARQLKYIPNKAAQSFRNGKTNTITVITSENIESGDVFSQEFFGILSGARKWHYDVLVKLVDAGGCNSTEQIGSVLGNRMSDGYIILGNELERIIEYIVHEELPGVLLSSHSAFPVCQVNVDGRRWIRELTELMILSGRKRLVYYTYGDQETEEKLRIAGFQDAVHRYGLEGEVFLCGSQGNQTEIQIKNCMDRLVDGIVCWNDKLAEQTIYLLKLIGKRVPQDVAVTGFDDLERHEQAEYGLTTVHQPFLSKGHRAVELLVKQIEGDYRDTEQHFVECRIIKRLSV